MAKRTPRLGARSLGLAAMAVAAGLVLGLSGCGDVSRPLGGNPPSGGGGGSGGGAGGIGGGGSVGSGGGGSGGGSGGGGGSVGCATIGCEIDCEYGFERDENGCETCRCRQAPPPPPPTCPDLLCDIACAPGQQVIDENGCPTCACKDPCWGAWRDETGTCRAPNDGLYPDECCQQQCPPVLCDVYCEWGHQTDENGCDTCSCNPPPDGSCQARGGQCQSSPSDPGFAANCEEELGQVTIDAACPAANQACCVPKEPDCRTSGCPEGHYCDICWVGYACIPDGAVC